MRLAVGAGGPAAENVAYVSALLGELERRRGQRAAARRAFEQALALVPKHAQSEAGLARLDHARERSQRLVERLPLPEYVDRARRGGARGGRENRRTHLALVAAERRLLDAAGVDTDVELAVFEADHGDPHSGRARPRRLEAAPSARAADALGWALTRAGEPEEGLR